MRTRGSRVHFIGIGGIGMSGLASVLLEQGVVVSGSDLQTNPETLRLQQLGATIHHGHHACHVRPDCDAVIVSSAIPPCHIEVQEATRLGLPVIPRLRALASELEKYRSIGVAGTHGKTTTTAMIATLMRPQRASFLVGAECPDLGGNAKLDSGQWMIAEIDESDGHLVDVTTTIAVLTNIGKDHVQTYESLDDIEGAFMAYLDGSEHVVLCIDDSRVARLSARYPEAVTVGIDAPADIRASGLSFDRWTTSFELNVRGTSHGRVSLPTPGRHNVRNALCALAAATIAGISIEDALEQLEGFRLPHRRFELLEENGVTVVDDYAHLPEEIEATLDAIREGWPGRRIVAIFQPHRFSRTQALGREFGSAFAGADAVLLNPIYSACESRIPGVSVSQISDAIVTETCCRVRTIASQEETVRCLEESIETGDFIISFGAGDVWKVTERLARILEEGHFLHRIPVAL